MLSSELEARRNLRVRSICSHMENKKNEIIGKVGLSLADNPQPKNLLSRAAMNFFFGTQYVASMDKAAHLQQSVAVAKFIRQNNLLPNIDKTLTAKFPNVSTVRRLIVAINVSFDEGRQPNTPNSAGLLLRRRENER